ncbi:MAG: hypothetical protein RMI91_06855 [Gemmatales bacterium]|nr:hypothetical protein [Gemmatales bacterium]MDW7994356.1 hypothetical protein [Gemmatales bacterium]
MRYMVFGVTLVIGLWLVEQIQAQDKPRPGFGRGLLGANRLVLLTQESVQADLKLTEEQRSKIRALQEQQRQAFRDLANLDREERAKRMRELAEKTEKELGSILTPEQAKRLGQIQLQLQLRRGDYRAVLANSEVASQLSLTNEQKEKISQLDAEFEKIMREGFQGGNRQEIFQRLQELRGKYEAVLTDQQKAKLKELSGEPFTGEIRFGPGQPGKPGAVPGKPGVRPRKPDA